MDESERQRAHIVDSKQLIHLEIQFVVEIEKANRSVKDTVHFQVRMK